MASNKSDGRLTVKPARTTNAAAASQRPRPAPPSGSGAAKAPPKAAPRTPREPEPGPARSATAKPAAAKPAGAKPAARPATAKTAPLRPAANATRPASAQPAQAARPTRPAEAPPRRRPPSEPPSGGRPKKPRRTPGRKRFRLLRFVWRAGVTMTLLGIVAVGSIIAYYAATMPPIAEWQVPQRPPNVAILSDTGELIANRGDTGGRSVSVADLPEFVPNAVIAIEDRRFYSHPGIDPIGLTRALVTNVMAGAARQGGSTLTQQLAKNLFLDPSRTLERKIQEMILSVWLEMKYSKTEILEMYLNRVYLGAGAYGIDGAARRYFAKPAEDLTIAEAALIAGLLKAPSYYAPTSDLERSNERAAVVINAMEDGGFINEMEALIARQNPATLKTPKVASSGGYVADWVAEVLPNFSGNFTGDVVVETTVNLELQELAQSALQEMLAEEGQAKKVGQGAVVVLDSSGAVKALVGGRRYDDSQYNRAVDAARQPGSSFKPFVYLAALEDGLTPQTMRIDQPTRIGNWSPENYSRKYYGPVSLERALAHSLNTIAAQLAAEVGPEQVVKTAHRLGIRSELSPNASIALGTSEVTLLELTTAYVPFSNGGVGVVPHVVRRIKTAEGKLLYERRGSGPGQVVSLENVGYMNRMLSAALTSGTAQRAQLPGWQAAGKTGTSQNWRDAWFVGYTAFFTAGVWLGNDDNSPTDHATGGSLPALLWKRLMENVHQGMVPAELPGAQEAIAALSANNAIPDDTPWDTSNSAMVAPDPQTGIVRGARRWGEFDGQQPQQERRGFFRWLSGG